MKRHWIEYEDEWRPQPMTPALYRMVPGVPWSGPRTFDPPSPPPVAGRGFPVYFVEVDGFTFRFASLRELDSCVEVLSKRLLPTSTQLAAERSGGIEGRANSIWLSRMPAGTKSWKYREKAVRFLSEAREHFVQETNTGEPRR